MFGVSRLTLRYYELRGLIWRRHVMDHVRVYGWADCERLSFIIKCRKAGLSLGEISKIIEATDDNISLRTFLLGQEKCMALVDQLERRRKIIDQALAELGHIHAVLTAKLLGESKPTRRG
jgi:DNA-binding transcriptional MerR regulator